MPLANLTTRKSNGFKAGNKLKYQSTILLMYVDIANILS